MGTKIIVLMLFSFSLFAQDEIQLGSEKIFTLENQVMVHRSNGEPYRMRTDQRTSRRLNPTDQVSEIFADTPEGGGRIRSLPGGIIIVLQAGTDIKAWSEENSQQVVRKVAEDTYLIKSSVGRKTLSEIQVVKELAQVQSATPNWWSNVESKGRVPAQKRKRKSHAELLGR